MIRRRQQEGLKKWTQEQLEELLQIGGAEGQGQRGRGTGAGAGPTHRHVGARPHKGVGHGIDELAAHAKVAQLDLPAGVDQDVGGLDVCRQTRGGDAFRDTQAVAKAQLLCESDLTDVNVTEGLQFSCSFTDLRSDSSPVILDFPHLIPETLNASIGI